MACIATPAVAQPGVATREPAADRPAIGRALADTVSPILLAARRDSAFPAAYVVIGDSRGVLYEGGVGTLDWAPSPAPDAHTLWDLASLTKIIATTTLAAQLVQHGALDLDARVQRYLPEWQGPGKERVRVRHLLTHTSGLPAFRAYDQQTQDPDSIARLLFATELERPPGEKMVYSDIGAFVLGRIIEELAGARLDTLAERRIFGPLGMHETMFLPPATLRPRIAPTEIDTLRGGLVHGQVHDERAYYLGGVAAHAGLFGSAHDLARFAMAMLGNGTLGGVRILDSTTVALFTAPAEPGVTNRALGWQTREREGQRDRYPSSSWEGARMSERAFGHTGFTGTSMAVDPELDLFVILLTNRVNPTRNNPRSITAIRRAVADAAVAILAPTPTSTDTPPSPSPSPSSHSR